MRIGIRNLLSGLRPCSPGGRPYHLPPRRPRSLGLVRPDIRLLAEATSPPSPLTVRLLAPVLSLLLTSLILAWGTSQLGQHR